MLFRSSSLVLPVLLLVTSCLLNVLQAAYEMVTDRGPISVRLGDMNGVKLSATKGNLDDYGRELPVQSNAECSSLAPTIFGESFRVQCSAITNQSPFSYETVIMPDRFMPPKYTQPAFNAIGLKKVKIDTTNYATNDDESILEASYFKQMFDESVTQILIKPIKHAQWLEDTNNRKSKQKNNNIEKYGTNMNDPNILLKSTEKNNINNNSNKNKSSINNNNKLLRTSDISQTSQNNGIKFFTVNADGTFSETNSIAMDNSDGSTANTNSDIDTNSNSNSNTNTNINSDSIEPMMEAAISQLVANALKGRNDGEDSNVVAMFADGAIPADPEQLQEEIKKLIYQNLNSGDFDPENLEVEFEIIYDQTDGTDSNGESNIDSDERDETDRNDYEFDEFDT